MKSFRAKDGGDEPPTAPGRNGERDFHGEKRTNDTHAEHDRSGRAAVSQGRRPAGEALLHGSCLMENRNGLVVLGGVSQATGTAEREQALALIDRHRGESNRRITLGADKAYDVTDFVGEPRSRSVTPHIAIDGHLSKTGKPRKTAIDRRTTRHAGYAVSQRCRKRIEEVFGWIKASAGLAKVKLRGRARVDAAFNLALAAYNLIRLPKLLGATA